MDNRDRQSRIERMRREKQRQERLRRRQRAIFKRCVAIVIAVGLVALLITGVWAVARPLFKENNAKKTPVEAAVDMDNTEAVEVTKPDDEQTLITPEASSTPMPTVTVTTVPTASPTVTPTPMVANESTHDGPAAQVSIEQPQDLKHAVPGWQVDKTGWWYANADNTYYTNGWVTLSGQKYYFGADGYMQTGWVPIGGKGCFFSETGKYQPDTKPKMIALTFDDGPGKYTDRLLDILDENNAKATFFMLGQCITEEYEATVKRMQNEGHELGNHTYSHAKLTDLSEADMREEFNGLDERIREVTGTEISTVARTPYGAQDEVVLRNVNHPVIYWDIDTKDWQTKDVQKNIESAMLAIEGSIILMHDIHETTVQSCETIIPKLIEQGYELVTVTELARAHGVEMKNGVTYYAFTEEKMAEMAAAEAAKAAEAESASTETTE